MALYERKKLILLVLIIVGLAFSITAIVAAVNVKSESLFNQFIFLGNAGDSVAYENSNFDNSFDVYKLEFTEVTGNVLVLVEKSDGAQKSFTVYNSELIVEIKGKITAITMWSNVDSVNIFIEIFGIKYNMNILYTSLGSVFGALWIPAQILLVKKKKIIHD